MAYSRRHAPISDPAIRSTGGVHRSTRRWRAPWRSRCACGFDRWPCTLERRSLPLAPSGLPGGTSAVRVRPAVPPSKSWNGPTLVLTPLLTRGQRWRTERQGRVSATVLHVPDRPSWWCRACGLEWPCQPAKDDIIATMDLVGRVIYMNLQMFDALSDQPDVDVAAIFDRFVGWARESWATDQTLSNESR